MQALLDMKQDFFKNKWFTRCCIGIIFLIIIGLFTLIFQKYVNWNSILKDKIDTYALTILPKHKVDFGEVKLNLLKSKLVIKNIAIFTSDLIHNNQVGVVNISMVDEVVIPFSVFNLFGKINSVENIILLRPKIFIDDSDVLNDLFITNESVEIGIENGHFSVKNNFSNLEKDLLDVNGKLQYNGKKGLSFQFKLKISDNYYKINLDRKDESRVLKINGNNNEFVIELDQSNKIKGSIHGKGDNFWTFLRDMISTKRKDFAFLNFNDDNFAFNVDFSFDDQMLQLQNLRLKSSLCNMNLALTNDGVQDNQSLAINVENLDLDALTKDKKSDAGNTGDNLLGSLVNVNDKYVLNTKIDVKNLIFNQNNVESQISFDVVNKSVIFNKLTANFNESNTIDLQGNILTADYDQARFYGKLNVAGNDLKSFSKLMGLKKTDLQNAFDIKDEKFVLKTELDVFPMIVKMTNFSFQVDDHLLFSDNILYKRYKTNGLILGELDGRDIKINLQNLNNSLEKNLLALSSFISSYNDDLEISSNINHLMVDNFAIDNVHFDTAIFKNKFVINDIYTNDNSDFGGQIGFYSSKIRPLMILNMKIDDLTFHLDEFERKKIEIDILKKMDVDVSLKSAKVGVNDVLLKNFDLHVNIENNLAIFDKLSFDVFDGRAHFVSLFDFTNFIFKSNIKAEQINLASLSSLSRLFDFNSGTFSLNGYVKSYGQNLYELTKKLYGQMKIVGKDVVVNNFDIDYLADNLIKMNDTRSVDLLVDRFLYGGQTKFKNFSGAFVIKNGLMRSNIKMVSGVTGGNFMGNIDIWEKSVDGLARFVFRPNYANENKKYEKFALDVKVKGILNSPERYTDTDVLKKYLFMGINPLKKKNQK